MPFGMAMSPFISPLLNFHHAQVSVPSKVNHNLIILQTLPVSKLWLPLVMVISQGMAKQRHGVLARKSGVIVEDSKKRSSTAPAKFS